MFRSLLGASALVYVLSVGSAWAQPTAAFPDDPSETSRAAPASEATRPKAPPPAPPRAAPPRSTPPPAPPRAAPPRSTPPPAPARAASPPAPRPAAAKAPAPSPQRAPQPGGGRPALGPSSLGFRPPALPAYGSLEPPAGYVERSRPDIGAIVSGALVFGFSYAAGIIAGSADQSGAGSLPFIPVLGPWLAIGQQDFNCSIETTEESIERCQGQIVSQAAIVATYAVAGVAQVLGVATVVRGLISRERLWVREDLAKRGSMRSGVAWTVFPYASSASAGVGIKGTF
jgi:hypothetical protein